MGVSNPDVIRVYNASLKGNPKLWKSRALLGAGALYVYHIAWNYCPIGLGVACVAYIGVVCS